MSDMELYGGEPFFQVLEAIEPSADLQIERSLALTTEACKISEARQKAIDSLKTGEEFRYKRHIASGDNLILRWSYQYVLEKLCAKEGLDKSKIKLETCSGEAISGNVSAIYRIDSFWELKHFYFSVISHFGLALGVEIDFEDTLNVPQPFVGTNHPDRVKTLEEGQRLRDELKKDHSEIVVVAQGGSKDEKRFSDSQVEDLVDQARDNFPDSYVVVASDKQYRRNENYNKPYGGKRTGRFLSIR